MRFRASWAVIFAAALLVGLLAYGVASKRADRSIDAAIAKGERVDAPIAHAAGAGRRGRSRRSPTTRARSSSSTSGPRGASRAREELPLLEKTQQSLAGRNATVLGANYQDLTDSALKFVRRFKLTYPSLRDRDGQFADRYGSRAFPETFVIDRRGRIAAQRRGPVDQAWLDRTLPPLLGETA